MLITAVGVALLAVVMLPGEIRKTEVEAQRPPMPPPEVLRVASNIHKAMHGPPRGLALVPRPVRRVHLYESKAALNLVGSREFQRRKRAKNKGRPLRGPPFNAHRGGPPPSKRRRKPNHRPNSRPNKAPHHGVQETRGTSPASARVRYKMNPNRPIIPSYADGFTESSEDIDPYQDDDQDSDHDNYRDSYGERPSRHSYSQPPTRNKSKHSKDYSGPPKRTKHSKTKTKHRTEGPPSSASTYGWGDDGGYRVPAPTYPSYTPDDTEEPGTGHLDLEERFINQHSQFYRDGYPSESKTKGTTRFKKKKPQFAEPPYESDESRDEYENLADSSRDRPSVVRGKPKPYLHEEEEDSSGYTVEYQAPSKVRTRTTRQPENPFRPTIHTPLDSYASSRPKGSNKFHAKFRKDGSSAEVYYNSGSEEKHGPLQNHRLEESHTTPSWQSNTPGEIKPSTYRTRPTYPQYWG